MQYSLRGLLGAALAVCALGCDTQPTGPERAVRLAVPASSFARTPLGVAQVPFEVQNRSGSDVAISRCGPFVAIEAQRRIGWDWVSYSGTVCIAIYPMDMVALGAYDQRSDSLRLSEAGVYRIRLVTEQGTVASSAFTIR